MRYIDPDQLEQAILQSQELGQPTAEFGKAILVMAKHIVRRPRFRGYPSHDDMIGSAALRVISVYKKYKRGRGGAFAWMTSVISNACLRYLREEERQQTLADRWAREVQHT